MPAVTYVRKVDTFSCTQWTKNLPPTQWPPHVDTCNLGDGSPHFHLTDTRITPLNETDWVVITDTTGGRQVLDDARFQLAFQRP